MTSWNPFRTAAEREPDVRHESLRNAPPFSGVNPTCAKCRYEHRVGNVNEYDATTNTIYRRCTGCGYTWSERAADEGGGT